MTSGSFQQNLERALRTEVDAAKTTTNDETPQQGVDSAAATQVSWIFSSREGREGRKPIKFLYRFMIAVVVYVETVAVYVVRLQYPFNYLTRVPACQHTRPHTLPHARSRTGAPAHTPARIHARVHARVHPMLCIIHPFLLSFF